MLLRKSRKHLQGASNRSPTPFINTFYKPTSLQPHLPTRNNLTCSTSHLKRRQQPTPNRNSQEQPSSSFAQNQLEQQLRKIYQGRRNIVKAVDGWGFDARGFITRQAFTEKLKEKLGVEPDEEEISDLLQKHCKDTQKVDAMELIELIHGSSEGVLFNQRLFSTDDASRQRDIKVENLKEDARAHQTTYKSQIDYPSIDKFLFKVNSAISRIKDLADGKLPPTKTLFFQQLIDQVIYHPHEKEALRKIEASLNYEEVRYSIQTHASVDHFFLDPILRKTHLARRPTDPPEFTYDSFPSEPFLNKMVKSATSPLAFLRNSQKRVDFDPLSMLHTSRLFANVDQQKTRFGGSKFTQESSGEALALKENVSPNQKELILQEIRSQTDQHRRRYQNKLGRLRQLQQIEGERIARREEQAQERDKQRLQRIKHQQEAYNYVNFLKKRWD